MDRLTGEHALTGEELRRRIAARLTERHVAGVWLGNTSASAPMLGVSGGGLPALIWRGIMVDATRA